MIENFKEAMELTGTIDIKLSKPTYPLLLSSFLYPFSMTCPSPPPGLIRLGLHFIHPILCHFLPECGFFILFHGYTKVAPAVSLGIAAPPMTPGTTFCAGEVSLSSDDSICCRLRPLPSFPHQQAESRNSMLENASQQLRSMSSVKKFVGWGSVLVKRGRGWGPLRSTTAANVVLVLAKLESRESSTPEQSSCGSHYGIPAVCLIIAIENSPSGRVQAARSVIVMCHA
jgi:hypothetical protein